MRVSPIERFVNFIKVKEFGCWEWQGSLTKGYGKFWNGDKWCNAYKWAYEYFNQTKVPKELVCDHLCRNRSCVNPDHIELVTNAENIRRGNTGINQRLVTHCPHGHEYTPENTYIKNRLHPRKKGRGCRICARALCLRSYYRKQERLKALEG
jgi:hypothetical protein